jgi:outer membrane protein assembly factor BamE (lipoprotein component of BamABCDE complex)
MYAGSALIILLFALSGCLYFGRDFSSAAVKTIENNVTTQKEIFNYFGEPVSRGLENGYETWTYSYDFYEMGQLRESKQLYIVFDKNNTVRTYAFTAK